MKCIISGRKYDTKTAKELGSYDSCLGSRDFRNYSESLYVKKTGEFFLSGEGGPMTKYSEPCGDNTTSGGEGIIPLSLQEAKEWVEKNMNAEDYEQIFGDVGE
jgi:hypothetical protein